MLTAGLACYTPIAAIGAIAVRIVFVTVAKTTITPLPKQ